MYIWIQKPRLPTMVPRIITSVIAARCQDISYFLNNKINPDEPITIVSVHYFWGFHCTSSFCRFLVSTKAWLTPLFETFRKKEMGTLSLPCVTVAYLYVYFSANTYTTGVRPESLPVANLKIPA